jgi:hypothetical protein
MTHRRIVLHAGIESSRSVLLPLVFNLFCNSTFDGVLRRVRRQKTSPQQQSEKSPNYKLKMANCKRGLKVRWLTSTAHSKS